MEATKTVPVAFEHDHPEFGKIQLVYLGAVQGGDWQVTCLEKTFPMRFGITLEQAADPLIQKVIAEQVVEVLETGDTNNSMPVDLSPEGVKAYETVMKVLTEHGALYTGGCKTFYAPSDWKRRGEKYGQGATLIVVYDGGDVGQFFSLDKAYPSYKTHTTMTEALKAAGFFVEECTGWYAAIYVDK